MASECASLRPRSPRDKPPANPGLTEPRRRLSAVLTHAQTFFNSERDCEYPFNSAKKRSSVLITKQDGSLRLYSKGASETSKHPSFFSFFLFFLSFFFSSLSFPQDLRAGEKDICAFFCTRR